MVLAFAYFFTLHALWSFINIWLRCDKVEQKSLFITSRMFCKYQNLGSGKDMTISVVTSISQELMTTLDLHIMFSFDSKLCCPRQIKTNQDP